jgi:hypothetical protein
MMIALTGVKHFINLNKKNMDYILRVSRDGRRFPGRQRTTLHNQAMYRKYSMPDEVIEYSIVQAFHQERFWFRYFPMYYDLFITIEDALLKAKTHSIADACKCLHERYGCSLCRIYEILKKDVLLNKVTLKESILNIDAKFDFIQCLEELSQIDEDESMDNRSHY